VLPRGRAVRPASLGHNHRKARRADSWPNTYVQQRIHLIWGTLRRQGFLTEEYRDSLYARIGGIIRYRRGVLFIAGGVEDHIHLYAEYPKTEALAALVNAIKSHFSRWLRETYPALAGFRWQSGYAGFSVQRRGEEALLGYINSQVEHHRRATFQKEYLALLAEHGVEYDLRYVFD
jgi:putative transposase